MPRAPATAASAEEWESVGMDGSKDEEPELPSDPPRARSSTPGKGSRSESKQAGQRTPGKHRATFIFEGKELERVTAHGKPVFAQLEEESKYDEELNIGPDLRDPRTHQGPCAGNHLQYYQGANAYGRWRHCYRCGVRLEYTPTPTAPTTSLMMVNPKMVQVALELLRMSGEWDTALYHHVNALIKTVQAMRGIPRAEEFKPEQIYEMMGMSRNPHRRKARVATEPDA